MIAASDQDATFHRTCVVCGEGFDCARPPTTHELSLPRKCDKCNPKLPKKRVCRHCNLEFIKTAGGRELHKFCCPEHREAFYVAQRKESVVKRCLRCEQPFVVGHGLQKYCLECVPIIKAGEKYKECEECKGGFVAASKRSRLCVKCRAGAERDRRLKVANRVQSGVRIVCDQMKIGSAAESLFDVLCARSGWQAAAPILETNPGWDRIIAHGPGNYQRIQVKGVSSSRHTKASWLMFRRERPITKAMCDVLAVVDIDTGDVWMMPVEEVPIEGSTFCPSDWESVRHNALGIKY